LASPETDSHEGPSDLDPLTSFYVLAWTPTSSRFDYDEVYAWRAVGVDLDKDIIGHVAEKKASEIICGQLETRSEGRLAG